jgi:hypothetical protein
MSKKAWNLILKSNFPYAIRGNSNTEKSVIGKEPN